MHDLDSLIYLNDKLPPSAVGITNTPEKPLGIMHYGTWTKGFITLCEEMTDVKLSIPLVFCEEEAQVTCQTCLEWLHA